MSSLREPTRRGVAGSSAAANPRSGAIRRASVRPTAGTGGVRASTSTVTARNLRQASVMAARIDRKQGAASPAESVASAGTKRKERDYESDAGGVGEETNINVVVRCRGRNDREVRENSAVVVSTEGVKGQVVDLSMGPSALSNKSYSFDRVFSSAADQSMVFDDVVKPILDEMLSGYNCTIFAYGQTGTGKTYTMTGDMTESMGLLSEAAGIIPRVLQALFNKLEIDDADNCVRCSFIELYNEELRDLLSADDSAKLKIYDDNSRRGHSTTVVQGMEERHITNAAEGIRRLQEGSVRRQVAATKCNDLSSRSHTVFTITVYIKKQGENGEDYVSAGKLNLVDLAGSENIQRSGAENKRAAEAGLINKSLLTLGRVINALVDHSAHIPYRESKLTRLLQDSLGGRTKTCIIATISPAKSNLEETISTLDYAFRAKNIRNKPQINAVMNKKTLLREFTAEIEKLRGELVATRQRNGVYLSNETYEEMTVQNESRRILTEEQAAKIETIETNLRTKVQELFDLNSSFVGLKKENEGTRLQLDDTKEILDQTELVLTATRKMLAEETHLRRAHQETEEKLAELGEELIGTLNKTVSDVGGLRAKNKRKSDLQALNRDAWTESQDRVAAVTELVEARVRDLQRGQGEHVSAVSDRMQSFVAHEVAKLEETQSLLDERLTQFAASKRELLSRRETSKQEMDDVLEEIKAVRDSIKSRVGESLQAIAAAAERIAADVLSELGEFHGQLHTSYSSLGRDFKAVLEYLLRSLASQRGESDRLRGQLEGAGEALIHANAAASARIRDLVAEERRQAAEERTKLLTQIADLIKGQAEAQEARLAGRAALLNQAVLDSTKEFEDQVVEYSQGMDEWGRQEDRLAGEVGESRDGMKNKLKKDWTIANKHSTSIQAITKSVHAETVRVVDEQMRDLDVQMQDLDAFVTRARAQNALHHAQDSATTETLAQTAESSLSALSTRATDALARAKEAGSDVEEATEAQRQTLDTLETVLGGPLAELRREVRGTRLREYQPTGETPEKTAYSFPTELPRTERHEEPASASATPSKPGPVPPSAAPVVFSDLDHQLGVTSRSPPPAAATTTTGRASTLGMSLREVNPNLTTGAIHFNPSASSMSLSALHGGPGDHTMPLFRRSTRAAAAKSKEGGGATNHRTSSAIVSSKGGLVVLGPTAIPTPGVGGGIGAFGEGRENVPPSSAAFSQSMSRRKSPRLH